MLSVWCTECGSRYDVLENDTLTELCERCRGARSDDVIPMFPLTPDEHATTFDIRVRMEGSFTLRRSDVSSDGEWRELLEAYAKGGRACDQAFEEFTYRADPDWTELEDVSRNAPTRAEPGERLTG